MPAVVYITQVEVVPVLGLGAQVGATTASAGFKLATASLSSLVSVAELLRDGIRERVQLGLVTQLPQIAEQTRPAMAAS